MTAIPYSVFTQRGWSTGLLFVNVYNNNEIQGVAEISWCQLLSTEHTRQSFLSHRVHSQPIYGYCYQHIALLHVVH